MANDFHSNPIRCDTAATIINTTPENGIFVQGIEWVSDAAAAGGAMAAADDLVMTINGVTVQLLCVIALTQTWVTHFAHPIRVLELIVSTIDGGTVLVWLG